VRDGRAEPAGLARTADDELTQPPRAPTPRASFRDAADRLVGADPGLTQLRTALQVVLGIGVALVLVYLFVRLTGALQLPAGSSAEPVLSATNHELLVVSLLCGGLAAMMAGLLVHDRTLRCQVRSMLLVALPMVAAMALGLLVGTYRVPSLAFLVVVMALAVYVRRFGPGGFGAGMGAFIGAFLGFLLHTDLGLGDTGWVAAELGLGVLAAQVVRFAFSRPPERTLARMRRSQVARARRLLALSVGVLGEEDERGIRRLEERMRRQLVRLNETTLMIDAELAEVRPRTAVVEAQRLFDAELAVSNSARFASALATSGAPPAVRRAAAAALSALLDGDPPSVSRAVAALRTAMPARCRASVLASRLAASVELYAQARDRVTRPVRDDEVAEAAGGDFTPAVTLVNGWLPGSTPVSAEASTSRGRGLLDRATMPPHVRATIQVAVAGTLAVVAGDALSGPRLYWAVLATFLAFVAATNSAEQVWRALFRVGGTAIGIVVGALLVHLTGGSYWPSVATVVVAMFFGIYLIRVNYTFMAIGITVTVAQLYAQLEEFSWQLLLLRLAETAVGVAAVVVTVLLIVPLRPQRVLTTGMLLWVCALRRLLEAVFVRLDGRREPLRPLVRDVDATYAALVATATPLRGATFGRNHSQLTEVLCVSSAVRQYARSLAAQAEEAEADGEFLPRADIGPLWAASEQLRRSVDEIGHHLATGERGRYVRSSALVAFVLDDLRLRESPLSNVVSDLTMLDGALARLAAALRMELADHDTDRRGGAAVGLRDEPSVKASPP
jgi:MFS family permease